MNIPNLAARHQAYRVSFLGSIAEGISLEGSLVLVLASKLKFAKRARIPVRVKINLMEC